MEMRCHAPNNMGWDGTKRSTTILLRTANIKVDKY